MSHASDLQLLNVAEVLDVGVSLAGKELRSPQEALKYSSKIFLKARVWPSKRITSTSLDASA
jgi:hypothetical protein